MHRVHLAVSHRHVQVRTQSPKSSDQVRVKLQTFHPPDAAST